MTLLQFNARVIPILNANYANTVKQIRKIIDKENIDIESLIIDLCNLDSTNMTVFSTDEAFTKVTNTVQLFHWIGKYCSMYDYELLLSLVQSIDCEEAVKLLDGFTEMLKHSILQSLDVLPELNNFKSLPGTHKLIIKFTGGKCTLKNKAIIQEVLNECFHLKKVSIIFRGAMEGCVAFVFQISNVVKSYLQQYRATIEEVDTLAKHSISQILIDNEKLMVISQDQKVKD